MKNFITVLLLSASFVNAARIEDTRTSDYVDILGEDSSIVKSESLTEEEKIQALIEADGFVNEGKSVAEVVNERRKSIAKGKPDPKEVLYKLNGVVQADVMAAVRAGMYLSLVKSPAKSKTRPVNPNGPVNPNKKPVNPNTPANPNKKPVNPNTPANPNKKPVNPNTPANPNKKPVNSNKKNLSTEELLKTVEKVYRDFDVRLGDKVSSIVKRGGVSTDLDEGGTAHANPNMYIDEPILVLGKPGNNYSGTSTAIHEMGHVIHMEYAREDVVTSTLTSKKPVSPSPIQYETVGMFFEFLATDSGITKLRNHLKSVKYSIESSASTVITEDAVDALPVVTEEAVDVLVEKYGGSKDRLTLIPYYMSSYIMAGLLASKLHELHLSGKVENFKDKLITLMETSSGASLQETFAPFGIDTKAPGVWMQLAKDFEKRLLNS